MGAKAPAPGVPAGSCPKSGLGSLTKAVRDIDVVLDTVGGDTVERSLDVLRPGGHLVTPVAEEDSKLAAKCEAAGMRSAASRSTPIRSRCAVSSHSSNRAGSGSMCNQIFPFERVVDAHRLHGAVTSRASSWSPSDPVGQADHQPPVGPLRTARPDTWCRVVAPSAWSGSRRRPVPCRGRW
ncbi:zinc-binding dehydrogenase [Streptomyces sp. NRRL WC-3618]|uniref:zinc-binding dehydrogenase n=1 Tax=Streptomyces sp. NRRL WC-3618 TaxID=1519490 RepID=UPI001F3DA2CE|nr:zinc-binding dehydrogenase [Streptomyces sp. NRRL WC-3618]